MDLMQHTSFVTMDLGKIFQLQFVSEIILGRSLTPLGIEKLCLFRPIYFFDYSSRLKRTVKTNAEFYLQNANLALVGHVPDLSIPD